MVDKIIRTKKFIKDTLQEGLPSELEDKEDVKTVRNNVLNQRKLLCKKDLRKHSKVMAYVIAPGIKLGKKERKVDQFMQNLCDECKSKFNITF